MQTCSLHPKILMVNASSSIGQPNRSFLHSTLLSVQDLVLEQVRSAVRYFLCTALCTDRLYVSSSTIGSFRQDTFRLFWCQKIVHRSWGVWKQLFSQEFLWQYDYRKNCLSTYKSDFSAIPPETSKIASLKRCVIKYIIAARNARRNLAESFLQRLFGSFLDIGVSSFVIAKDYSSRVLQRAGPLVASHGQAWRLKREIAVGSPLHVYWFPLWRWRVSIASSMVSINNGYALLTRRDDEIPVREYSLSFHLFIATSLNAQRS